MNSKKILIIFLVILLFQSIKAQYPLSTSYQSITTPNVAMPSLLQTVTDNSVPSPIDITRITEYYTPWNWYPTFEYPKTQVWNADQSQYRIRSWKVYDAQTHIETQSLTGSIYPSYWSNSNPDLIWSFKENGTIKKYFVSSNTEQSVDTITGYEFVKLGPGEGNIDNNDHFVALIGKNGLDLDVIIYDLQNLQITHTETFIGAWDVGNSLSNAWPKFIDWISISQSGNYVGIMWDHNVTSSSNPYNGHFGVELYNTTDMQYLRRIADYGNHGDFGYAANGNEVFVQFWGPNLVDFVNMYFLDGSGRVSIATHSDFDAAGHISCRNINRPGWAYLTISSLGQSGQMVALKLDNSGIVEHFGHHFSSNTTYSKTAMAVPSPNGDKIMFKSDFGNSGNTDLVYCFEAKAAIFCVAPISQTVNNISSSNADLFWISDSSSYYIEWGPSGFVQGTGNYVTISAVDSFHLFNLDFTNSYDWYITNICNGDSVWLGPNSFTTLACSNTFSTLNEIACDSFVWSQTNISYFNSGVFSDTIQNIEGCDSIIELNLTIHIQTFDTIYYTICNENPSFVLNDGTIVDSVGIYKTTLLNASDCMHTTTYNIDACNVLSIKNKDKSTNILLYPNPANNEIIFKANEDIKSISIYNIFGKKVKNIVFVNQKELTIDISQLSKGLYVFEWSTIKDEKNLFKLVVE